MDTKAFEYISAIVRYGTLSGAAEKLYISQPALTQYISKLETSLNVRLFTREGRKLKLTGAGEIFLEEGGKILHTLSDLQHRLANSKNTEKITIRLGISQFYCQFYLPYILPLFQRKHPNIQFEITEALTSELEDLLINGKLDVALVPIYIAREELEYNTIYKEEILLAVPCHSHLNALAEPGRFGMTIDLKKLRNEKFIILSPRQKFYDLGIRLCKEHHFTPNIICEVLEWNTLNLLVKEGMGIGFVPNILSATPRSNTSPNYYHIASDHRVIRPYAIATRKSSRPNPITAEFVETVLSLAENRLIPNMQFY